MYDRKIQCITKLKKCNTNKYIVFKCDTPLFSISPIPGYPEFDFSGGASP